MMMFFDILLLDDDVCLAKPHRERRLLLQKVVNTIQGRAELAHQEVLDFNRVGSPNRLVQMFEKAITQRWEGYVLKASDEPYFPIYCAGVDRMFGRWIKLKKDYIPGLGDTLDFALIGAYYNSQDALDLGQVKKLKWTHFFVGCLLNKEDVVKSDAVPHFRVVDVIGRHSMSILTMQTLNQMGEFCARQPDSYDGFRVEYGHQPLPIATTLFKHPFIVEMLGSGFDKPSGARYWTLRFPRILKVHGDRSLEEAASFQELQCQAEVARAVPTDDLEELEEREKWSKRLKAGSGLNQYIVRSSSPEATCSDTDEADDADEATPSSQPRQAFENSTASGDSMMEARPLVIDLLDDSMGEETLCGLHDAPSSPPVVYIDEPTISTDVRDPVPDNSVLAENENLSSRQKPSQEDEKTASQELENLLSLENPPMPPSLGVTSPMQTTSTTCTPKLSSQEPQEPQAPLLGTLLAPASLKPKRKVAPKSPLTTIPMWTPETSLGSFNLPHDDGRCTKDTEQHDLRRFLQCICSDSMGSLLNQSNPSAASQGTRFGIVMFDPKTSRLGEEILKVATNLSGVVHSARDPVPSEGKIFFLGSSMLDRDLCPSDLRFCLRDTWTDVGRHDSYGCISWDLNRKSKSKIAEAGEPHFGRIPHSLDMRDETSQQHSSVSSTPLIQITFDGSDIAVLGEYISLEPLAHILDL
jgi:DNA ligase-4